MITISNNNDNDHKHYNSNNNNKLKGVVPYSSPALTVQRAQLWPTALPQAVTTNIPCLPFTYMIIGMM